MRIFHDHPCEPFDTPGGAPGETFTYDCRCGRLTLKGSSDFTILLNKE